MCPGLAMPLPRCRRRCRVNGFAGWGAEVARRGPINRCSSSSEAGREEPALPPHASPDLLECSVAWLYIGNTPSGHRPLGADFEFDFGAGAGTRTPDPRFKRPLL